MLVRKDTSSSTLQEEFDRHIRNRKSSILEQALFDAIGSGNDKLVDHFFTLIVKESLGGLFTDEHSLAAVNNEGKGFLSVALEKNQITIANQLLSRYLACQSDVKWQHTEVSPLAALWVVDNEYHTALWWALKVKQNKIVKQILAFTDRAELIFYPIKQRASCFSLVDSQKTNVLSLAVQEGDAENFYTLLKNITNNYDKKKKKLLTEQIKLQQAKEIINRADKDNNTPLHHACLLNNLDFARALVETGALTQVLNNKEQTPLSFACKNANADLAEYLIRHGAKLTYKSLHSNADIHLLNEVPVDKRVKFMTDLDQQGALLEQQIDFAKLGISQEDLVLTNSPVKKSHLFVQTLRMRTADKEKVQQQIKLILRYAKHALMQEHLARQERLLLADFYYPLYGMQKGLKRLIQKKISMDHDYLIQVPLVNQISGHPTCVTTNDANDLEKTVTVDPLNKLSHIIPIVYFQRLEKELQQQENQQTEWINREVSEKMTVVDEQVLARNRQDLEDLIRSLCFLHDKIQSEFNYAVHAKRYYIISSIIFIALTALSILGLFLTGALAATSPNLTFFVAFLTLGTIALCSIVALVRTGLQNNMRVPEDYIQPIFNLNSVHRKHYEEFLQHFRLLTTAYHSLVNTETEDFDRLLQAHLEKITHIDLPIDQLMTELNALTDTLQSLLHEQIIVKRLPIQNLSLFANREVRITVVENENRQEANERTRLLRHQV